jgi:uncharacterized protein YqgC (DUF456 family)
MAAAMNPETPKHASHPSGDRPENRSGGGVFIAIGAIVGAIAGGFMGQPSAGLLAGLALGALAALAIWWTGR